MYTHKWKKAAWQWFTHFTEVYLLQIIDGFFKTNMQTRVNFCHVSKWANLTRGMSLTPPPPPP
jgi:hypothetical protein